MSFVPGRCFLERLPLLTIMAKDDQCHMITLDQVQEFARAGAQFLLVLKRPGLSIRGKKALQDNSVNCQQHRTDLRQAYQHRLVSRCMPASLYPKESGQQLCISLNQSVAQ